MKNFLNKTKYLSILLIAAALLLSGCSEVSENDSTASTSAASTTADNTSSTSTLSAPSGVTATGGSQQVVLAWTAVSGASSYTVYWDNASGITSSDTAITSITTDNYTHTSLDNSTTYYYKVAAVDSSGTGTLSSEVSANTNSAAGAATYTVTFNSNYSGGPSSTTQTVTDNVSTALTATNFTRTGYSFSGWATSSSGGVIYNDTQSVAFSANTTLYAVWFDTSGGKTLLLHYNFDQQNASDNTSNSNDGTLYNMTFVSEGSGYAASFDGSSSEIRMPDSLIKDQTDFTIMFRFKTSGSGILLGYQTALAASSPSNYVHILSIAPDSGKIRGDLFSNDGHFIVDSTDNVSDNQWHTVYFSAKASSIALYLDGTQLTTATNTVAHLDMTKNQLGVGRYGGSNWDGFVNSQVYYYNGLIDDFKFYNGALH